MRKSSDPTENDFNLIIEVVKISKSVVFTKIQYIHRVTKHFTSYIYDVLYFVKVRTSTTSQLIIYLLTNFVKSRTSTKNFSFGRIKDEVVR